MHRLDDNAFTVQSMVVPKHASVSVVVFLSRDVSLTPEQQKALKLSFRGARNKKEGEQLLGIQKRLLV
ncbi:MAG: hypothetical protein ABSB82_04250 [Terriglobia bacterium]|jgi:hypothetical protein